MAPHPVAQKLNATNTLREIPVKVIFDTPDSNIVGRYEAWSEGCPSGPVCIGDGDRAKMYDADTNAWKAMPCRGPALCQRAAMPDVGCSFSARMQVEILDESVAGRIFELRTNSLNTYKAISGELHQYRASHGALRHLKLSLVGWVKSSPASNFEPFACAALNVVDKLGEPATASAEWEEFGAKAVQALLDECVPTELESQAIEQFSVARVTSQSGARKAITGAPAEGVFVRAMQQQGNHSDPHQPTH